VTVPNESGTARKAAVYRLHAADGTLLYIGSSYDPDKRCEAHHRTQWWPQVARRTDEWFENRWKAYSAETAAIWKEQPKHNLAGSRDYRRKASTAPGPRRWRVGYLAYTGRRDACATNEVLPVYAAVLDSPDGVEQAYIRRAESIASELIEDMEGLGWDSRRRMLEKGRQFAIRSLRDDGADDVDVAVVMAIVEAQTRQLPYLPDDEPHGSRQSEDGTVVYVVHAERASYKHFWNYHVPVLGLGGPWVESFEAIEDAARITISKRSRWSYEQVAVRIRTPQ